jgi:hypothetical protein
MRLAITVGGALAIAVSAQVPLPTIDDAALDRLAGWTSDVPGLFWLGIVPVISAMGVVEIVALAVPRWRKLRHGGPQGRARLARASATLAVALALVQGWFIATWLMSFDSFGAGSLLRVDIPFPRMATVLSLAAGTLVILLFAAAVGRLGLASPISLVLGAGLAAEIVQSMWALGAERLLEASPPAHAPLILGAIIAIAIATWRTLRRRANADGRPAYRLPTSGLIPLATASSLLVLVSSLETLGLVPPIWLHRILAPATTAGHAVYLALAALLAVGCSWLFSRPSLVAALCPGRVDPAATSATRSAFAGATAASVGFVIALGILGSALSSTVPAIAVSVISVATLTAIVMDVVDEWRARRAAAADLVDVWPLHQVPAIDLVLAALRRDGIAAHARGANHRALLHFFGPHVPIAILVPRPDAERARALIASLFVSAA